MKNVHPSILVSSKYFVDVEIYKHANTAVLFAIMLVCKVHFIIM